ncbi:MAG: Glutamate-1-semialdehyde aminotransferase [Candidatus Carbobacillus altaicus]|uniref:Glutamate-1-semialdehyde aminotransferase n=1 Tax=Candidatus Carbonibacillus altaicus TaxID=2163959 RepID=A0A2R6Y521_9BACL|nr:MAG: Glutamate-1-semialdehyde aminotransferase [Candidatus Carbobacillus altaicus]
MLTLFWTEGPVVDFASAKTQDVNLFVRFHALLLERGIYAPSSAFEAWFVSLAHDQVIIEETIEKITDAMGVLAGEHIS